MLFDLFCFETSAFYLNLKNNSIEWFWWTLTKLLNLISLVSASVTHILICEGGTVSCFLYFPIDVLALLNESTVEPSLLKNNISDFLSNLVVFCSGQLLERDRHQQRITFAQNPTPNWQLLDNKWKWAINHSDLVSYGLRQPNDTVVCPLFICSRRGEFYSLRWNKPSASISLIAQFH